MDKNEGKSVLLALLLLCPAWIGSQMPASAEEVARLVSAGRWQQAVERIAAGLNRTDLSFGERQELLFQRERLERIGRDFSQTRSQVLAEMQRLVPQVSTSQLERWEKQGCVEYLDVDGQRRYFRFAAANVFRVNAEARALKRKFQKAPNKEFEALKDNISEIIAAAEKSSKDLIAPRRFRITYRLAVAADAVAPGQTVRAWLPFPRQADRQRDALLVRGDPAPCLITDADRPLRCAYLEKIAQAGQPTVFEIVFEYTSFGRRVPIDAAKVMGINPARPDLQPYLVERPPHIVFTPGLRELSQQIVGNEKNPYRRARLIFAWVSQHVPWASAREYSTIDSLCLYALQHRWGDCGIQTMLFMALCRLNGIPTRWQSGWTTGRNWNMHDWCQIYLEPYGWVPADVSYGLMPSADERVKFFYLGGIDSYRLVVNDEYGQMLFPAKMFFRSETVDFQRGEVEWAGGNLYFDRWDWDFEIEELKE